MDSISEQHKIDDRENEKETGAMKKKSLKNVNVNKNIAFFSVSYAFMSIKTFPITGRPNKDPKPARTYPLFFV